MDRYPEMIQELGKDNVYRRLAKPFVALAYVCLAEGDHSHARHLMQRALRFWPTNPSYLRYYLMTFLSPQFLAKLKSIYETNRSKVSTPSDAEQSRWHSAGTLKS